MRIAQKLIIAGKADQEIAHITELPLKTIKALRKKI
jgi:DNA-binding CsgD family transcriptional regulator